MTYSARLDPRGLRSNRIARVLITAGLFLTPACIPGWSPGRADGEGSSSPSVTAGTLPVVDVPAPWFWDEISGQRVGGRAHRFELESPGRTAGMSAWYFLAYVLGDSRLSAYEHTSPGTLGSGSVIARSQNVAWHVAVSLLGLSDGVARPGEIPDWALARTGNSNGRSAGLLFALAYLDVLTPGALAGDVRVAATGAIASDGRITRVRLVEAKLAAALLIGADVVFAPTFPAGSGDVTVIGPPNGRPSTNQTVGDLLDTDGYENAGRLAATQPGSVALVPVHDIRQALSWLCGRTQRPATCELARKAASASVADARPPTSTPAAPTSGPA